jgi:DNA modification methylase
MPSRYFNRYIVGDARCLEEFLPAAPIIDVTITSPPYWNLKNYGSRRQIGFGQSYATFLGELKKIFRSIFEMTKDTGSLWIVADTIKCQGELKLFPFDLAARLKEVGWSLQDIIIWSKDKTLPWSHRGKLRNIFEYILFFSKGPKFRYHLSELRETNGLKDWWIRYPERYSPEGKAPSRNWTIAIPTQGSWSENWVRHFCPLPPDLVKKIVLLTTRKGDVVLDPFAGSGIVLAQASALKRRFIGVDLRQSYRRMFEENVRPSVSRLDKGLCKSVDAQTRHKKKFSSLIWSLRKVKYARELVRLYRKHYGRLPVSGVVALSSGRRRLKVVLLFGPTIKIRADVQPKLEALRHRPPLSKYGLRVLVSTIRLGSNLSAIAAKRIRSDSKLALYTGTNTHRSIGYATVKQFVGSLLTLNGSRPKPSFSIASNLRLKVTKQSLQ